MSYQLTIEPIGHTIEIQDGMPAMNFQLCKYRTQIVGYEDEDD